MREQTQKAKPRDTGPGRSFNDGRSLRAGDVINFGRRVQPPEFEFIFEATEDPVAFPWPPRENTEALPSSWILGTCWEDQFGK